MTGGTSVTVVKPKGLPTATSAAEREALQALAETQLADTRKAAENWRTGLAGLLALVTTVSLVKGRDSFDKYDADGQDALIVLLAFTLVTAAWGTWFALKAAYGQPGRVKTKTIDDAGGVSAWNMERASHAASDLRWAQLLSYLSLAGFAATAATTLLADKPSAAPPAYVSVEETDPAATSCGELLRFDGESIVVKLGEENNREIDAANIRAVTLVASCDESG